MVNAPPHPERILHLASNVRWTGVAEPATSLARKQMEAGCQVWVGAVWGRSFEQQLRALGVPRAESLDLRRLYNPFAIAGQIRIIRKFVLQNRVQVVHTHLLHDHWLAALALRGIAPAERPLLVRTVHRYEAMRRDPWHRWLFQRATGLLITVSAEQRDLILAAYPSTTPRLKVIHGGIDPEHFRPDQPGAASVRADMGERPDSMVAAIVAHLGYNRGHKWLLAAAPRVVETLPKAVIWIVGQGELKKWLRKELQAPRYRGRVLLAGYRSEDLPDTYAAVNVGLLLGLGSEGSARAALECMATARPVIAVRKGALAETITDGVDGFLVPENDTEALADALIRLLGDPDLCRRMGEAARQKVLSGFTEQTRADRTMEAYREVLGR